MSLIGSAAMVAIYDVDGGWEDRHDHWHSHEHMEERVGIPGFLRGRRYLAEGPGTRCFVLYEASSLDVLTSEAYLACLNHPTAWSSQTMPHFRNVTRTLCQVRVSVGAGLGGKMAYVPLSAAPSHADALRRGVEERFSELVGQPGILAAHLLEGDACASSIQTKEKELRGQSDSVADWLLVVEGYVGPAHALETGPLSGQVLTGLGAASVGAVSSYTLGALLGEGDSSR
jgi:hypothetical protein